jgi:hypothetical protein
MTRQKVYRFQTKIKTGSSEEILINFLKDRDSDLTERERLLQALSAFWLPLALIEANNFSEKEIALHALTAILRLKEQIAHLSLVLSVKVPAYAHIFTGNLTGEAVIPTNNRNEQVAASGGNQVKPCAAVEGLDTDTKATTDKHNQLEMFGELGGTPTTASNNGFEEFAQYLELE